MAALHDGSSMTMASARPGRRSEAGSARACRILWSRTNRRNCRCSTIASGEVGVEPTVTVHVDDLSADRTRLSWRFGRLYEHH